MRTGRLMVGLSLVTLFGAGAEQPAPAPSCCGVTYTSKKCACPAERPSDCSCASCTHDENCECVAAIKTGKGVIAGTVKSRYVKKYATVVFIEDVGHKFPPPARHLVLDQKAKEFRPRVLPVLVGSTVDFHNSDDFEHNVFSPDGEKYNLGNWKKNEVRSYTFRRTGAYVQLCSIHPEMLGYVLVLKSPYFAPVKEDGRFEIANVPPGSWKLKVWNERFRKKSLEKEFEVEVRAGRRAEVQLAP